MTDYEKLEYIHCAIQRAMESLYDWRHESDPELCQALEFVEDLREPYLTESSESVSADQERWYRNLAGN